MTKLKAMRLQKGLMQGEIADAARVSRPFFYDLENGKRRARPDTWERIAAYIGCNVEDIIEDEQLARMNAKEVNQVNQTFRYYCPARPPMPGAVPRGATRVEYSDDEYMIDEQGHTRKAWGFVEYDRQLSDKEVDDYELDPEYQP